MSAVTLAERLGSLNEGPIFLPTEFLQTVVFPQIVFSYLLLSTLYIIALYWAPSGASLRVTRKNCYTATNFVANLILTCAGFYYEFRYIMGSSATEEEKTQGYEPLVFLSCFQLGFQFWAIPVGFFYVNESPAMLAHHFTVIAVAIMSGFLRNGFRYWTAFFYGVIELSSLPLSIMNYFKENPSLIAKYPGWYDTIRLVFAGAFLLVRIILFVPRLFLYLRDHYLLYSQHPNIFYRIFMATCGASSFFLLVLQIYWGVLIVRGVIKGFTKAYKKKL
ncbi:hypothetical protein FisN_22Lh026 [Fistulifera solaris]|uniref:TLC domain-containing protein n=1 Tax=Fistulifera solaris TaxID=1519565 RepID=A0A1Z5JBM9_FISSO|nr:hypothetical protein FisN_22Lh026 [Fistulifera solaris]|eukprot:GAX11356.1 hypothetical protein FisN_22Lh026 [Fistulifera solaris]